MIASSKLPLIALACFAFGFMDAEAAQSVDLDFSNPVGTQQSDQYFGLGPVINSATMSYLGVANVGGTSVDMRVTASVYGSYQFYGHYGDYNQALNQPEGDMGLLYYNTGVGSGGLDYLLEFYVGGTNFSTRYTLNQFDLMVYDVDGEANQTESFRTYNSDGLLSYKLAQNNSLTATKISGGMNFMGGGTDLSEQDASGAVILTYANTNAVTLHFQSTTSSGQYNGVFSAIDGDLSMTNDDPAGTWASAVPVPEPSSALLVIIFGMFAVGRRSRR